MLEHEVALSGKKKADTILAKKLLYIMRSYIPIDTGNMTNNAIYYQRRPNGFAIVFDERFAPYMRYVNEGLAPYNKLSPKQRMNMNFVERAILAGAVELQGRSDNRARQINITTLNRVNLKPAFSLDLDSDSTTTQQIDNILDVAKSEKEKENADILKKYLMRNKIDLSNLNFMKHEMITKAGNENATEVSSYVGMARALARFKYSISSYSIIDADNEESGEE